GEPSSPQRPPGLPVLPPLSSPGHAMTGASMDGQLFCHVRAGVILSFKLGENSVIGRDQANAVAVPVEGVSRMHARIRFDGKSYWLQDLKSTNGTFLNGQAVTRERLRHLDVITLGRELDLVFVVRASAEVQKFLAIVRAAGVPGSPPDRKSTRLNSSHEWLSYAV